MNKAEYALQEFHEIDELADGNSPVHRFSALSKLTVTVAYLLVLLSFDQYDLSGVFTMAVYPYILFAMSSLSLIPVFLLFLFFNRYLMDGVTAGSVKG